MKSVIEMQRNLSNKFQNTQSCLSYHAHMLDSLFDQVLYYYKLPLSTCLLATNIYLFDILFKKGSFKSQELQHWIFMAYSGYEVLVFPGW